MHTVSQNFAPATFDPLDRLESMLLKGAPLAKVYRIARQDPDPEAPTLAAPTVVRPSKKDNWAPRSVQRQAVGRPRWFQALVYCAWKRRHEVRALDELGAIPVLVRRPDENLFAVVQPLGALKQATHTFALNEQMPSFDLIALFYERAEKTTIPLLAYCNKAPFGVVIGVPRSEGGA